MRKSLLLILSFTSFLAFSQTNLVPNPTFSQVEKKIKAKGQINVATPWTSPTLAPADLYVPKSKNYDISIPENSYGEEKPMEGEGYAGIVAYSYKNKVPRTYLQVQLTEQLEEGKEYCVKFHVSLADLSKYACNYLGIAVTNEAMTANNSDILKFDEYIKSRRLTIYEKQFYWTAVCGVYKAKGGEEYITIGNFEPEEKLTIKKVKRPRGFTKPQTYDAYYYIDNVSVTLTDENSKCDCDVIPGMENAETVVRDFNSDKNVNTTTLKIINTDGTVANEGDSDKGNSTTVEGNAEDGIDGMVIGFASKSYTMSKEATGKADKIVAFMKANTTAKITLTGYIDASESDVDKLDGRRASTIYKYIVSKGVPKERIKREMGGDMAIDDKQKTKNMRVEVVLDNDDTEETEE